jgi:hypothetical protein
MDVKVGIGAPAHVDHVADLIQELEREVSHNYARPYVKRDAHPKMHGCVQAVMTVNGNLDPDLRVGVFAPDGRPAYRAWVRFSNAFQIQHDLEWETRGIAIKLLGLKAGELLEPDTVSGTHDFLCATHSAFFLADRDVALYKEFAIAAATAPGKVLGFFLGHKKFRGLWALIRGAGWFGKPVLNPVALTYYSQTPYKFGDHEVVKLRLRPTTDGARPPLVRQLWWYLKIVAANLILMRSAKGARKSQQESWLDKYIAAPNFLRMNMSAFLATRPATFDVQVQFWRRGMPPDDDPTRPWSERRSQFRSVATLTIPRQVFWPAPGMPKPILEATKEMMALGEHMSFDPWHAIKAHRPIGGINDVRRRIYKALSNFRHHQNGIDVAMRDDPDTKLIPTIEQYDRLADQVQFGRV